MTLSTYTVYNGRLANITVFAGQQQYIKRMDALSRDVTIGLLHENVVFLLWPLVIIFYLLMVFECHRKRS